MKTQIEKLRDLAESRDPFLKMQRFLTERAMAEAINKLEIAKGDKGDDGYTPIKGYDYYTQEELDAIVKHIKSMVKDGEKGDKGDKGETGPQGRPGETPVKGVDYFTKEEKAKLVEDVIKKLPKDKDVTPEDIVKMVLKQITLPNTKELIYKSELAEFLRRGGFRGGGDTVSAGAGISITTINGIKEISAGSGSFTKLTATGTVDDSNTDFVFIQKPVAIVMNGTTYYDGDTTGGTVAWTWNAGTLTATMFSPVGTGNSIWGIA